MQSIIVFASNSENEEIKNRMQFFEIEYFFFSISSVMAGSKVDAKSS